MKPFIQDGHTLALRAVRALVDRQSGEAGEAGGAGEAGVRMIVEEIATTDWASATFVGKRHRCQLRLEGSETAVADAVARLARELPEVDVAASGYFLADAAMGDFALMLEGPASVATFEVEALTIEE